MNMEGCIKVESDIDKLLSKFDAYKKQNSETLDQLYEQVCNLRDEISRAAEEGSLSRSHHSLMSQHNKKFKVSIQNIASQHRDLHSSVSKIGKTIDKNFDSECNAVNMPEILPDKQHVTLLNTAICEHFYRQGSLSVAEGLAKECSLEIDDNWRQPFLEMNNVLDSLKNREVDQALLWAEKNEDQLSDSNSDLNFKLHQLKFLQILKEGPSAQVKALQFARNFQKFSPQNSHEIQQLMGCFLYLKQDLSMSPYAALLSETVWDDIYSTFSKEACKLMGMSVDSPLVATFNAGCQALPALAALKSVIDQRQCGGVLSNIDELPIDIDIDSSQRYHSIVACPILRQQTTQKNPPMRLICGHVISKDALNKLVSGSKVKCPYCPVEQSPNDAKEIFY